ncbi:MAG: diacylglycerol/lipid kinase family protein [Candidatus Limivicinus sp.]|jgi:diacylglycerol kinase (ATP)
MKHLFIVNPTAGGKDATKAVEAMAGKAFAERGISSSEYEIYVTKAPMDAPDKIRREAAGGEHLRVYACGGDGTFNECVCGAAQLDNVAVCPLPTGTGNDFCRMFGDEAELYRDLDAILDGTEHPIDLIDCNGRWCANICSVGIDARIGTDVHKYSSLPLCGGAAAYVVSAIVNMLKGISRRMYIKCGDFYAEGDHTLVCACNGRYYGGGFNPSKYARPDDGIMDIYVVKKVSLFTFARLIKKYAEGEVETFKDRAVHLRGREIEIGFDEENVINVDGEALHSDIARLKLVPGCLRLIVPRGNSFFGNEKPAEAPGV